VAPIVARVAAANEGQVQVVEIDASQMPEQARALKVRGTPTLLAARDGVVVARHVGAGGSTEVEGVFAAAVGEGTGGGIGTTNRRLRTLAGAAVLTIAVFAGNWILAAIGIAFIVAGWYDLLPSQR
jgi:thioredoxin-like negative regulator of GroEL